MHWKIALCSLSIGSNSAPPAVHLGHEHRPGHHQRFLVGEQHALAGPAPPPASAAARPRRRSPPSRYRLRAAVASVAMACAPASTSVEAPSARAASRMSSALEPPPGRPSAASGPEARGTARHACLVASGHRQRNDAVAIRMARHDIERALADRSGGAEDGDALHGTASELDQRRQAALAPQRSGCRCDRARRRARATVVPLSFTPAWRLSRLSNAGRPTLTASERSPGAGPAAAPSSTGKSD
jgi:hypothetical protein